MDDAAGGDTLFSTLADEHLADAEVTWGRVLGRDALAVRGTAFALLEGGRLAVKLSPSRAAEVAASPEAEPVALGPDRTLRHWVAVAPPADGDEPWRSLLAEARRHATAVADLGQKGPGRRGKRSSS
jgi:hypothetical protein